MRGAGFDRVVRCLAAALVVVAGCSSSVPSAVSSYSRRSAGPPRLAWHDCAGPAQCASLRVPVSWRDPNGPSIALALYRRRALDPGTRIGVLIVNPGGPGAEGRPLADHADAVFSPRLRRRFDIVSWDPRGTGGSEPLRCGRHLDRFFGVDRSPDTSAERAANIDVARTLAEECEGTDGQVLAHVGTAETVHDVDAIRRALGESTISYLGFSYGTMIGSRYAVEFPVHVRAMVLDGPVDPSIDAVSSSIQQAEGFERALGAFLHACDTSRSCAFDSGRGAGAAFAAIRRSVETRRLRGVVAGERRVLSPSEFLLGVATALYGGSDGDAQLDDALDGLRRNDASAMLRAADEYTGRGPTGDYPPSQAAFYAVSCADGQGVGDLALLESAAERAAGAAPVFGADTLWLSSPCAFWPGRPGETPKRLVAPHGLVTPLVVSTLEDPATPAAWGRSLAAQLRARLVTVEGRAHTAYASGNTCVERTVDDYLVDGVLPAQSGTHC